MFSKVIYILYYISYNTLFYFIKIETLGKGTFGKVKLCIYPPTGEKFAVKILNKKTIAERNEMNLVKRELEIINKFNHESVIKVFNVLEDQKNYYILMEYCAKGELFDYIVANQKLSEDESAIFFYQLVNGVEHIHSKGVAHRDLKPENLLLTGNKRLKIIDFGLSSLFDGKNLLTTKCGSPSYAAW
ncbi:MAG: protein kinase [archaeon]|nr:protein kinase [archaeon]